jgi:uncharacterized membrane protein YhaH (DUF805 family)
MQIMVVSQVVNRMSIVRGDTMYWYLRVLKKYAVFSGRARRAEYWQFTVVYYTIAILLSLLLILAAGAGVQKALWSLAFVYNLAMILPSLAVTVRRLHDTNHSGWWMLISLVPIIGGIIFLVWMVTDSDPYENQYGRNPKAESLLSVNGYEQIEVGRRRARWLPPLVLAAALVAVVAGGFFYAIDRGTEEARTLAPWPEANASAEEVASVDLTPLGLQITGKRDAHAVYGSDAPFVDGAAIEFGTAGNATAVVTALRYASAADAGSHFSSLQGWARGNCPLSTYANWGEAGVIRCAYGGGHDRILWSGNWILDIETTDRGGLPAADLADRVRDAAAAHWQGLSNGSQ